MPIYEYQGQQYDIATDDPVAAKQKILKYLNPQPEKTGTDYVKDFGKSAASLADTGLNMVTGTLDAAAYPFANAYYSTIGGLSPEAAAAKATLETTSPKDPIGRAAGITQDAAYQGEVSRRAMEAIGQGVQQVTTPIAQATGIPQQSVDNMANTLMMGAGVKAAPYINKAGSAVGSAVYAAEPYIAGAVRAPIAAVKAPFQFAKGAYEGVMNPEYRPGSSAMVPMQETYYPQAAVDRYMGKQPGVPPQTFEQLQTQARPTAELVSGPVSQAALKLAPKTPDGLPLVPLEGQGIQAWGERVGRGVRKEPLQAMAEVGLTSLTGIPFKTIGQGAQGAAASWLGNKTGFVPGFTERYAAGPVTPGSIPAPIRAEAAARITPVAPQQMPPQQMPPGGNQLNMMSTPKKLENINGAAQDVMQGKLAGEQNYNTTYTHKGDTVYETKSPGYHSVELEHPDGSRTVFKVHQYADKTEYIKTSWNKENRPSPAQRSTTPFPDFVSVENVMKKKVK